MHEVRKRKNAIRWARLPGMARGIRLTRPSACTGWFPSAKLGALVPCESALEVRACAAMERDPGIAVFRPQPETFRWRDAEGRRRRYTPDFLVEHADGARSYREVKPSRVLARDPTLGGRRSEIEAECARRGASFVIWTEQDDGFRRRRP